jgi:CheY-like chemotaxis protein
MVNPTGPAPTMSASIAESCMTNDLTFYAFEGLEAIKRSRPNLVLSDIKMPGRDGFELLPEIRALRSNDGGGTPIIAMSGLQAPAERMRIVGAGFQAFFQSLSVRRG